MKGPLETMVEEDSGESMVGERKTQENDARDENTRGRHERTIGDDGRRGRWIEDGEG